MQTTKIESFFRLIGNYISAINITNDFILFDQNSKYKKSFDLSHRIINITDFDDNCFSGYLELTAVAVVSKAKEKYKAKIVVTGIFLGEKEILDQSAFKEMLITSGIGALYSIARSTLISISAQTLSRGSVILPMINVLEYSQNTTEE